jgi:cysteine desulfurase
MRIYLDHNATTPLLSEASVTLARVTNEVFGNPSSIHQEGQVARRVLEEARDAVADLIHATPREVVFTSGGTESSNAGLYGAVGDFNLCHIVTSAIEHPSVLEPVMDLQKRGRAEVTVVRANREGVVQADAVIDAIRPDTRLVALMLANNETGVVQPVAEVAAFCRQRGIHVHCDAVQAAGKIPINVQDLQVDTLALSAHKFHAPKGIGVLYVRQGVTLRPIVLGGSQERRRRSGTENVPSIAAMGAAARVVADLSVMSRVEKLRDEMEAELLRQVSHARINGAGAPRLPNTSSICFEGVDAEAVVIGMDLDGIAISSGSACSSGRVEPSRVLLGMGLSDQDARSSIRVSLSRFTKGSEIEQALTLLKKLTARKSSEVLAGNA